MASLEELNNLVQQLQAQVLKDRADILTLENELIKKQSATEIELVKTKQELELTKQELELAKQELRMQQIIQQQQEEINKLRNQLIDSKSDIIKLEQNVYHKQEAIEAKVQKAQEHFEQTKIQQEANLDAQIQRFNILIDKLKNSEGKTLRFACGSTEPGNTQWVQHSQDTVCVDIDTKSAGFSEKPFYFTSLGPADSHWVTTGATSIYSSENKGLNESFRIYVRFIEAITPDKANKFKWHIQWLAVGV